MLQKNAFDNIVHEHLEYYSMTSLTHLLERHGLRIVDVEFNDLNGGSFRTFIRRYEKKSSAVAAESVMKALRDEARLKLDTAALYKDFAKRVKEIKSALSWIVRRKVKVFGKASLCLRSIN